MQFNKEYNKFCNRLLFTLVACVIAFITWAQYAAIDEVTRGSARIKSAENTKILQHLEGGIIEDVFFKEGDSIKRGDTIMNIQNMESYTLLNQYESELVNIDLAILRVSSLINNLEFVKPDDFDSKFDNLYKQQSYLFDSTKAAFRAKLGSLLEQKKQFQFQKESMQSELDGYIDNEGYVVEEMEIMKKLVDQDIAPRVEYLDLKKEYSKALSNVKSTRSNIEKLNRHIQEVLGDIEQETQAFKANLNQEMQDHMKNKSDIESQIKIASDRVSRKSLVSPVDGVIKRMYKVTKSGVVRAGEDIVEITPSHKSIVAEMRVRPKDVGFLYPGQSAVVRIAAYDYSIYGSIDGTVSYVGSDSIKDESKDTYYFNVEISIPVNHIKYNNSKYYITSGMSGSVDIITGKKTVMSYILKPINKTRLSALRER